MSEVKPRESKFSPKPETVEVETSVLEKLLSRVEQLETAQAAIKPTGASIEAIKRKHTLQETKEEREARRPAEAELLKGIRAAHAATMRKVNRKFRDGAIMFNDRGGR